MSNSVLGSYDHGSSKSIGIILVLFILLVIIIKTFKWS
ncbi:YjcZ family sporulation protein [Neobacillus mesonae]|nr:YjcZ family sporulation protein [Neobacillus mesonae]